MALWTYPATVTNEPRGAAFTALLDLGCKLYLPAAVAIAGLRPRPNSDVALQLIHMLPVGTRVLLTAGQADSETPLRAHVSVNGVDAASHVRGKHTEPVHAQYGGTLDKVWTYPATVITTIDADTVKVRAQLGTRAELVTNVRVEGVNSPEHGTAEGDAATVWAERVLAPGTDVTITSHRLDKYGRLLGSLTTPDGLDYGALLIGAGHAVPYNGGMR